MKCSKAILLSILLLASNSAFSAITTVSPGGGLQAAITAASEGDTILLESGVYTNADSQIEIGVSLTIKAASAAMSPIIQDSLVISGSIAIDRLTIQGIQVDYISTSSGQLNELEILESTLAGQTEIPSSSGLSKFTMIASTLACGWNNIDISAGDIVLTGNSICSELSNTFSATAQGNETITIVGNSFISQNGAGRTLLVIANSAEALVASNRFIEQWAKPGNTYSGDLISYYWMQSSNNERLTVKNNIFVAQTDRLTAGATLRKISVLLNTTNLHFENNLVDAGNINIWVPSLGEAEQEGMMEYGAVTPTTLKGNVFINYNDNVLPLPATGIDVNPQFNLCFNNVTNCGTTNGNLDADPHLVDSIDYKLGVGSPAIDAGPVDAVLSDLDGSRNNIGPYGGSWSIDQYDAQRAPGAVGPYLYPVVDAAKGVANGNVKVKFISYGRQL